MAEERDYNLLSATQQAELLKSQGLGFQDEGSALEEIEVSVRTQLSRIITDLTNDPFWFMNPSNFCDGDFANNLMETFQRELERNDDEFIVGYMSRSENTMPPIWAVMEVSSFGTTSKLFKNLRRVQYRSAVARYYGIPRTIMKIWLHALVSVRNICAHYNRLWNKNLNITPTIPRHTSLPFLSTIPRTDRIYYVMSIILYFLQSINPQNTFAYRIKELLREYPHIDVRAMGFPNGWENEILWQS